jgi:hypothetical protein
MDLCATWTLPTIMGSRRGGGSRRNRWSTTASENELHRPDCDHAVGAPLAQGEALSHVVGSADGLVMSGLNL